MGWGHEGKRCNMDADVVGVRCPESRSEVAEAEVHLSDLDVLDVLLVLLPVLLRPLAALLRLHLEVR